MTDKPMTLAEQNKVLREALKQCYRALSSKWSPYLRASDEDAAAMKVACAALALPVVEDGWMPIDSAPENMTECVVVRWVTNDGDEAREFDYKEDGCWMNWHDKAEQAEIVGIGGMSYTAPYEQWLPLPPITDAINTQEDNHD